MNKNLNALVLLLVVCAIGALQNSRREDLRLDMQRSLALLWENADQQVRLTGPDQHLRADVAVTMPIFVPYGHAGWNFQLLRFVARRHGSVRLEGLSIRDLKSSELLGENPWSNPAGNAHQQLRGRQLEKWLDQTVGSANGLVLMNVDSAPIVTAKPGEDTHSC